MTLPIALLCLALAMVVAGLLLSYRDRQSGLLSKTRVAYCACCHVWPVTDQQECPLCGSPLSEVRRTSVRRSQLAKKG